MDAYEVVFHPDFVAEFRAFDDEVKDICGGDKSGVSSDKFYKALIAKADARFSWWLDV